MTAVIIAPELERVVVVKRGIMQVENCFARLACHCYRHGELRSDCSGIPITAIPAELHAIEYEIRQVQQKFIDRQRVRGFELFDGEMRLHGPFPSYDYRHTLANLTQVNELYRDRNGDEHPELALSTVFERVENGFRDYVFVGKFLTRAVLTEVIIPDDNG